MKPLNAEAEIAAQKNLEAMKSHQSKIKYSLFVGLLAAVIFSNESLLAQGKDALPSLVTAAQPSPFYFDIHGGAGWSDELELSGAGGQFDLDLDTGYSVGGAVGMRMGQFRFEMEGAYRSNDIESADRGRGSVNSDGDISAWSIMWNAAIDIPLADRLSLYAGAGLGLAGANLDLTYPGGRIDDDNTSLAWQVFAGLTYQMSPEMETYVGYQLFRAEDIDFGSSLTVDDYQTQGIVAGVRINF